MDKKRVFISFVICCLSISFAVSQNEVIDDGSRGYLERGKLLYQDKSYVACIDQMTEARVLTRDEAVREEADYLIAMSHYHRGSRITPDLLQKFLNDYPRSSHVLSVRYTMGNYYFFDIHKRYPETHFQEAIKYYKELDITQLNGNDRTDFCFRLAFSFFKTGEPNRARPLFEVLKRESKTYRDAASFYLAYLDYTDGKYDDAIRQFTELKDAPRFGTPSRFYIAQIRFLRKEYQAVWDVGTELLQKNPSSRFRFELSRLLGESAYHLGMKSEVGRYLTYYIDNTEKPLRSSLYIMGVSNYDLDLYSSVASYLTRVVDEDDALTQSAYLYLGHAYLKQNDKANARMAYQAASKYTFDKAVREVALYNYAMCLYDSASAFDAPVDVFEQFLNEYPSSKYVDSVNDRLVEVYMTTRNYQSALVSIGKIKKPNAKVLAAKQYITFHMGTEAFANTQLDKAKNYFSEVIRMGDYDKDVRMQAMFWLGECLFRSGSYEDALLCYSSYTTRGDKRSEIYPLAWYDLGYCYFKLKRFAKALSSFEQYVSLSSRNDRAMRADALVRAGDSYYALRQYKSASESYYKSYSSYPSAGDYALFQYAFMEGLQGKHEAKIKSIDRLLRDYPQSDYRAEAINEKAQSCMAIKRTDDAIASYKRLIADYPQHPLSRKAGLQLGMIYFNRGDMENSIRSYEALVAAYPTSQEAKSAINDLKSVYLEKNDIDTYAEYLRSVSDIVPYQVSEIDSLSYLSAERVYLREKGNTSGFDKYVEKYPSGAFAAQAHYYIGKEAYAAKAYDKALASFDYVLTNRPDGENYEEILTDKSELLLTTGRKQEALPCYRELARIASAADARRAARMTVLRLSYDLQDYAAVPDLAKALLDDDKLSPELQQETRYLRAKAHVAVGNPAASLPDWEVLAADTRSEYGAESAYLAAQYCFDQSDLAGAEAKTNAFIEQSTPHSYWLARGFILLADIYQSRGEVFTAKQYLQNLQSNYPGSGDDIASRIEERLLKLNEYTKE